MPRASRSVAIKTWVVPFLNSASAASRSDWLLSPCSAVATMPALLSFLVKLSAFSFAPINTSTCGHWCCFKRATKACVLLPLFTKYSVSCTAWLMLFSGLAETWVGARINCCALSFKSSEKVAEHITVWRTPAV